MNYFKNIFEGFSSIASGLKLTLKHLYQARKSHTASNVFDDDYFFQDTGIVTLDYPFETLAIPDNGRYRLHNEVDDCIVCDKCAVVCPVDCIAIEAIKSSEPIGETSDGSVKRLFAGVFDIDMAKCCFCGLCTTVCPTECLTMTKAYDFSEVDIKNLNYHYSNLSPEESIEKKSLYEQFVKEKEALKSQKIVVAPAENISKKVETIILIGNEEKAEVKENNQDPIISVTKPTIAKPKFGKPIIKTSSENDSPQKIGEERAEATPISDEAAEPNSEVKKEADISPKPLIPKPKFIKPIIKNPNDINISTQKPTNESE